MNILFYRYGSVCEPDVIAGFSELGNFVSEITVEITEKNLPADECVRIVSKALQKRAYDFIFSINFYPFLSEICNIYGILYICWTVDCPVLELLSHSVENKCNRIFLFDPAQYREIAPRNPDCVFYLPLATNPERWTSVIAQAPASFRQKYSHDVSFVGSLYTEKCPYDRINAMPDFLSGYLDGLMAAQQKIYGYYFLEEVLSDQTVEEFKAFAPDFYIPPEKAIRNDKAVMARLYLCSKISAQERVRAMTILSKRHPVDLYTASDTKRLPVNNRGLAKTLTEMPLIFHFSKINLNMTSRAIREGLPLRIFDVLGCQGFLLTNYQADIPSYFTPGVDLECYGSEDELLSKTEYYLTHEKDRREIAQNGFTAIKNYHNYPKRLLEMLSMAYRISSENERTMPHENSFS